NELSVKMMAEESDFFTHGELNHTAKAVPSAGPSGCLIHEAGSRVLTIKDNTEFEVPLRPTAAAYAISASPASVFKLLIDGNPAPEPSAAGMALEGNIKAGYHRFKVIPGSAARCKQTDWVLACGGTIFQHDFQLGRAVRPLLYAGLAGLALGAPGLAARICGLA